MKNFKFDAKLVNQFLNKVLSKLIINLPLYTVYLHKEQLLACCKNTNSDFK